MKSDLRFSIEELGAIPLQRYCDITGEKPNAIHQRIHRGVWKEGREVFRPTGSDYWICLIAVHHWVKKRNGEEVAALIERRVQEEARG